MSLFADLIQSVIMDFICHVLLWLLMYSLKLGISLSTTKVIVCMACIIGWVLYITQ